MLQSGTAPWLPLDSARVLKTAKSLGFEDGQIYLEESRSWRLDSAGRMHHCRSFDERGAAIRMLRNGVWFQGFTPHLHTEALLLLLKGNLSAQPAPLLSSSLLPSVPMEERCLQSALKTSRALFDLELEHTRIRYTQKLRRFCVVDWNGNPHSGHEEEAVFHYELWSSLDLPPIQGERVDHSFERMSQVLEDPNPLLSQVLQQLQPATRWPVPTGKYPIVWSSRSLSKLYAQLLHAFEGDLVLDGTSFLSAPDLQTPLPLRIEDGRNESGPQYDHEGSEIRTTLFFDNGRPRALACDQRTAKRMSVPSTGNARREGFRFPTVIGFWSPRIQGMNKPSPLLAQVDFGLSVHDIRISDFDLKRGNLSVELTDAHLVHQGEEGEPTEKVVLHTHVMSLLETLVGFGTEESFHGFLRKKNNQTHVYSIHSQNALSHPIELPGTVPRSFYP